MNCPSCGNANPDASNFCGHCGARTHAAAPPAPAPAAAPRAEPQIARTAAFEFGALPFDQSINPSVTAPGTSDAGPTMLGEPGLPSSPDLDPANATAHDVAVVGSPSPLAPAPDSGGPLTAEQSPVSPRPALSAGDMQRLATATTATSPTATALLTALPMPGQLAPTPVAAPAAAAVAPAASVAVPAAAPKPVVAAPAQAPAPAGTSPAVSAPAPLARPAVSAAPAVALGKPAAAAPAKAEAPAKGEAPAKAEASAKAQAPAKAEAPARVVALGKPKADEAAPAAPPASAPPKAGGFRETAWFMDALATENLAEIEEQDISQRAAKFDDVKDIDEAQRRQFSLRSGTNTPKLDAGQVDDARAQASGAKPATAKTSSAPAPAAPVPDDLDAPPASRSPMLYILLAVVVLGGLGATAWYLFFRG